MKERQKDRWTERQMNKYKKAVKRTERKKNIHTCRRRDKGKSNL